MSGTSAHASKSLSSQLAQRIGNPLKWCAADKCSLVAVITLVILAMYWELVGFQLRHPEAAPYIYVPFLEQFAIPFIWVYAASCAIILATGLSVRWRWPDNRALVYATALNYGLGTVVVASYFFGPFTNPYTVTVLLAFVAVGFVLFDKRPIGLGLAAALLGLFVMTIAEQGGLIPYAPMFSSSPVKDGRLSNTWLVGTGGVTFVVALGIAGLIYYVIARWHDREERLARTGEQLSRATDAISRYVAAQVAEQILAGNHEVVNRQERRKLTLFFSDIKDFSALADQIEPEDLSRLLNQYLAEMTGIAERYGATIDKFVGDAIMMFFGAPVATDDRDHALKSVKMAVDMQRRMRELRKKWLHEGIEEPFEIRIGVNTGVASVGNFGSPGRMDYTAIGRQVNLAARLQANCEPGKILLSHSTWLLVEDEIPCEPKGEIQVKGVHYPVRVYEVIDGLQTS